jgi:WD40 repeat protein
MPYVPTSLGPECPDPYPASGCFHRELLAAPIVALLCCLWPVRDGGLQPRWSDVGKLPARMGREGQVKAVAFSHDGRWLATGGTDSLVRV